jgi:hypothetical protein
MIKIYYSKDEGWFTPSYHTNYRLWGTLKETYPKCHYTLVIDRFEDTTFPFKIKEDIHLFSDGVEVSIVNEDNTEVDFRVQGTHSRFCELSWLYNVSGG